VRNPWVEISSKFSSGTHSPLLPQVKMTLNCSKVEGISTRRLGFSCGRKSLKLLKRRKPQIFPRSRNARAAAFCNNSNPHHQIGRQLSYSKGRKPALQQSKKELKQTFKINRYIL